MNTATTNKPLDKDQLMQFAGRLANPENVVVDTMRDQINPAGHYFDPGGLTVGQHTHLTLIAACISGGLASGLDTKVTLDRVRKILPTVLQELAMSNTYVERSFDPPIPIPHSHLPAPLRLADDPTVDAGCIGCELVRRNGVWGRR